MRKQEDKCLPWYYPQVDPEARLCSPFEAIKLQKMIDTISNKKCRVLDEKQDMFGSQELGTVKLFHLLFI